MAYPAQVGSNIGNLLRMIQEQKSQSPILPVSSDPSAPQREAVQQPLSSSEGYGTNKVVSVRPEGTLTPTGQPKEQITPGASRAGPISIGGAEVPVPPTPGAPVPTPAPTGAPATPPSPSVRTPSLGTVLGASTPQNNQVYNRQGVNITPAQQIAQITAENEAFAKEFSQPNAVSNFVATGSSKQAPAPSPTPTPAPSQSTSRPTLSEPLKPAISYNSTVRPTYTQAPPVNLGTAISSGGLSQPVAPTPSKPQSSVINTLATILKKSPFSYLFGR